MSSDGQKASKRSISASAQLWQAADARWPELEHLNIKNLSQYIQHLMRKDVTAHRKSKITQAHHPKISGVDETKKSLKGIRQKKDVPK
jgi:hypothetical protein